MRTKRQNIQLELALEPAAKGEARSAGAQGTEACMARAEPERPAAGQEPSMEAVVKPGNLKKALARVRRNKGAPGVDGMGGANWGGASFDPTSSVLYVNSMDVGALVRMVKRPEGSKTPYRNRGTKYGRFWDSNQYPCQKPPWGTLTAIDLETGEFRWQSTLGVVDDLIERGVPKTGAPNLGGSIVTAGGLVFIAATNDKRFRAFDKDTGKELWVTRLPDSGHATPMTFLGTKTGKQFVVIAAGGGNDYNKTAGGKLVAFSLP